ncbi:MAG TPA: diguanylate cyclase [Spirochaetota bacterium]|nr:diguanylate cyclase [Spirochaetota bacterium]HPJ14254.1 diguanylate cyclase [Spirochaetota bacterium]HPM33650.1 diguanylate cyclase [Spirochaetota bacterium]HQO21942.1 diguanylate cyclase [Spirochaetota bacterium]HQQ22886.1 diguanylate cyclase [Spirochaetota bacterium]
MGLREKAERILRGKFSAEKYPEIEPEIIYDDDSVSLPNKNISSESLEIEDEFGGDSKFPDIETDFTENDISNMIIDEIPEPFFSEDNIDISNNVSEITAKDDLSVLGIDDDQTDLSEDQTKTSETVNVSDIDKLSHNDNLLLIEIAKEIMKSSSIIHLKETAIFSIMSYLSVEGVSVISPESEDSDKWILSDSKGVKIKSKRITFNSSDSIFNDIFEKGILFDITEYANSSSEEYLKFKSIGSKILISITDKNKPVLLISVCSKINGENFSDAEKRFIRELSEFMSLAAGSCLESDRLKSQNLTLLDNSRKLVDIDTYEERIRKSAADSDIENYIRGEMANNGVSSFAFFERDDKDDVFKLKYSEEKDSLNFQKKSFSISLDNAFTAYLFSINGYAVIENPINNEVLHRIFDEEMLARMNIFVSMPYVIRGRLTGFALILRADIDHLPSNLVQINRLSKVVFSFFQNSRSIEIFTSKYYDLLSSYLKKLSDEIKHADEMNIPLTFSGFCIKNMKRLVTVYGEKQADDILFSLSEAIAKRLSETDFAVRYSRNSIIAVFPGKQKKSVAVAANIIKNEVTEKFRKYEVPVMINFLTCEYPDEAKTLDEILSVVE